MSINQLEKHVKSGVLAMAALLKESTHPNELLSDLIKTHAPSNYHELEQCLADDPLSFVVDGTLGYIEPDDLKRLQNSIRQRLIKAAKKAYKELQD